ncbi:UBC19 [Auxenochlorella protothecoides x Auxenochlorella symbiontica]
MSISKSCATRLQKEYKAIVRDPVPCIEAHPSPSSLLEWHFVLQGQDEFKGGVYHGKITFPSSYPYKPPSILMFTPNGRFATNTKLCMSMTDFHPESWNPMWSVGTILTGLLSFMYDSANSTGVVTSTPAEKAALAAQSLAFNVRSPTFRKLFPHWVARHEEAQRAAPPPGMEGGCRPPEQDAAEGPAGPASAPAAAAPAPPPATAPVLTSWSFLAAALLVAGGAVALGILHLSRVAEQ